MDTSRRIWIIDPGRSPRRHRNTGPAAPSRRAHLPVVMALIALATLAVAPSVSRAEQAVVRFAIFPSRSIVPCFEDIDWRYVGDIERLLANRPDAELAFSYYTRKPQGYSFYARAPGSEALPPIGQLWTGTVSRGEPALDTVIATARQMDVDAVVMAWIRCNQHSIHPPHLYRVEIYVVDVDSGRVYREESRADSSGQAAAKAIGQLLTDRTAPRGG